MAQKFQRKPFVAANEYQRQVVLLAFVPAMVMCAMIAVTMTIFYNELIDVILNAGPAKSVRMINQWGVLILFSYVLFLVLIVMWIYLISRNLVGAFGRIIKELDDIISGKSRKPITARPADKLANELLKRVNVLIDGYRPK